MFTSNMKLADVIQSNFNTLGVICRFGIKLGFGDKSIKQVCDDYIINYDFFLEILNAYNDPSYFPQKHLQSFSVGEIVSYLRKTHDNYTLEVIPYLESLMHDLVKDCKNPKEMKLVQQFFDEYKVELFKHLRWEDEKIFPYALSIENAYLNSENEKETKELMKRYTMSNFLNEHDDIESKLYDIKTLFVKYLPPVANQQLCIRILREFSLLEKDLNDHSRIEEKVLAPKVIEMEKVILSK